MTQWGKVIFQCHANNKWQNQYCNAKMSCLKICFPNFTAPCKTRYRTFLSLFAFPDYLEEDSFHIWNFLTCYYYQQGNTEDITKTHEGATASRKINKLYRSLHQHSQHWLDWQFIFSWTVSCLFGAPENMRAYRMLRSDLPEPLLSLGLLPLLTPHMQFFALIFCKTSCSLPKVRPGKHCSPLWPCPPYQVLIICL
jgi:hypothetical protein